MLTSNVRKEEPNRNDMSKQMPTNTMPSTNASAEPSNRSSSTFLSGFLSQSTEPNVRSNSASNTAAKAANTASSFLANMANVVNVTRQEGTYRLLLVIEHRPTDWSRLFENKRINGNIGIKVEQFNFDEIAIISTTDGMVQCSIKGARNEKDRRIKPDFVLIRQQPHTPHHKNVLLALKMAGVPSMNSMHSLYNFFDPPWVLAQLSRIQNRVGKEQFPTVATTMLPNAGALRRYRDFPAVVISGNRQDARLRIRSRDQIEDIIPILQQANEYILVEPLIKSVYELHIIRIGGIYRVFVRTTAETEVAVERVEINDKYKLWIDAVCELFGGLDIAGVRAIHTHDGKDLIVQVENSWLNLENIARSDDESLIADAVVKKIEKALRPKMPLTNDEGKNDNTKSVLNMNHPNVSASEPSSPGHTPEHKSIQPMMQKAVRQSLPTSPTYTRKVEQPSIAETQGAEKIRNLRNSFANYFS